MRKKILFGFLIVILLAIGTLFITSKMTSKPIKVEEMFRARQYPNVAIVHISPTNSAKLNYIYRIEIWKSNTLRYEGNIIFTTYSVDDFTGSGKVQISFSLTNEEVAQYSFRPRAFELDASQSEDLGKYFETKIIDGNKATFLEPSKDKSQTPVQDAILIVGGIFVVGFILLLIFGRSGGSGGGVPVEDVTTIYDSKTGEAVYEMRTPRQSQTFQEPCSNCHGTGWWNERRGITCSECGGSGVTYKEM